jgi:hypothetical protein
MADLKTLKQHPASAEYPEIAPAVFERMRAGLREFGILGDRAVYLYKGQVVDGWHFYRACVLENIKPKIKSIPKTVPPAKVCEMLNDNRRHESQDVLERPAAKRREQVAELHAEGHSSRAVAEQLGVDEKTIRNDLAVSGAEGSAPGKVKGKDGKSYPAKPPKQLCERCTRVGVTKGCSMCAELRNKKAKRKKADKPPDTDTPRVYDFNNPLPKRCRDAFCDPFIQSTFDYLAALSEEFRGRKMQQGMEKRAARYPFIHSKDFVDSCDFIVQYLDGILDHLKANRPAGVCAACAGEGCGVCKMSGLLPREEYAKVRQLKT